MFGSRKKFVEFAEAVDNDFPDDMYYNQAPMFPHRSDKDVSVGVILTTHTHTHTHTTHLICLH